MHHQQRRGGGELDREVAVADGVERILGDGLEPESLRHECAIDREGGAGQRSRPERQSIDAAARVEHALAVALEHLDVGQQVVAEGHRLGDLQVGEARHHGVRVSARPARRVSLCSARSAATMAIDLAAQPQAQVGGHLVVARAAGVQPLAGVADEIGQPLLDVEVHVLELEFPRELASFDLADRICAKPRSIAARSSLEMMLRAREHRGMGERPFDIRERQPVVEPHRRGVAQHEVGHRFLESTRPGAAFRGQGTGRFRGVL